MIPYSIELLKRIKQDKQDKQDNDDSLKGISFKRRRDSSAIDDIKSVDC